jgi:hypothetical protein
MVMSNKTKLVIFLVFCFAVIYITKNIKNTSSDNTMEIGGVKVYRAPYLTLVTQMFEQSVDSNKTCDCLIKSYYDVIKTDSTKLQVFLKTKEFSIDSQNSNLIHTAFNNCVLKNIRDSTYKLKFIGIFRQIFLRDIKLEMKQYSEFERFNADTVATCLASKLDRNITIEEFYKEDNQTTNKYKSVFRDCIFYEKSRLDTLR